MGLRVSADGALLGWQAGWLAWLVNLLRQMRDASGSEASKQQQKATADVVGVSHETHPRLLQACLPAHRP